MAADTVEEVSISAFASHHISELCRLQNLTRLELWSDESDSETDEVVLPSLQGSVRWLRLCYCTVKTTELLLELYSQSLTDLEVHEYFTTKYVWKLLKKRECPRLQQVVLRNLTEKPRRYHKVRQRCWAVLRT